MEIINLTEQWKQDEIGQWWYYFGTKKPTRTKGWLINCAHCNALVLKSKAHQNTITCSRTCGLRFSYKNNNPKPRKGKNHYNWKGGRKRKQDPYVRIYVSNPLNIKGGKYVKEHRLVMEQVLGRPLQQHENIHHINGVKDDNRPENLELWSTSQPTGQRVEDKITWAIELLKFYKPEVLKV